jgi:hypothetical protein
LRAREGNRGNHDDPVAMHRDTFLLGILAGIAGAFGIRLPFAAARSGALRLYWS